MEFSVKPLHPIALLACTLPLIGCSSSSHTPVQGWDMPQMQVLDDNGLPPKSYTRCNKRGCHDTTPLFFDPTKSEPDATTLHRDW